MITLETVPGVVEDIQETVNEIKRLLLEKSNPIQEVEDEILTVQDAAKLLALTVPTIYGLISKGELPIMKRSKRVYFSRQELINYLKQGRKKTISEIAAEANSYLLTKKTR